MSKIITVIMVIVSFVLFQAEPRVMAAGRVMVTTWVRAVATVAATAAPSN